MEDGSDDEAAAAVPRGVNILTADLGRHAGPRPSDGEVHPNRGIVCGEFAAG